MVQKKSGAGGNAGPLKRGMGCAVGTWGGGGNNQCKVDVTISRDGSVLVAVGTQDLGTAHARTRERSSRRARPTDQGRQGTHRQFETRHAQSFRWFDHAPSLSPSVKDAAIKAAC
jgi:xanthine dehydrogenase YagR molybdenum-binding subunit